MLKPRSRILLPLHLLLMRGGENADENESVWLHQAYLYDEFKFSC